MKTVKYGVVRENTLGGKLVLSVVKVLGRVRGYDDRYKVQYPGESSTYERWMDVADIAECRSDAITRRAEIIDSLPEDQDFDYN